MDSVFRPVGYGYGYGYGYGDGDGYGYGYGTPSNNRRIRRAGGQDQ